MNPLTRHDADVLRTMDQLYLAALVLKRDAKTQIGILKFAGARARFHLVRWRGAAGAWRVRKILEDRG